MDKFANNNQRFKSGEIDGLHVVATESFYPPRAGSPFTCSITHCLEARRMTEIDAESGGMEAWIEFYGVSTLVGPFEDLPMQVAESIVQQTADPEVEQTKARCEVAHWYEVSNDDPDSLEVGHTVRFLDIYDDPLYIVSDEIKDPADISGTPEDLDVDEGDIVDPNYHYQRRIHEAIGGSADDQERLALEMLMIETLDEEIDQHYAWSQLEIAVTCFRSLKKALKRQVGA